jgi:hypothetical protein
LLAMVAAAVALKDAVDAPAATVTEAGTVSEVLLLARVTAEPPVGAVWDRVTVQLLTADWPRVVGKQLRYDNKTGAVKLIAAVFEPVPRVAVTTAL